MDMTSSSDTQEDRALVILPRKSQLQPTKPTSLAEFSLAKIARRDSVRRHNQAMAGRVIATPHLPPSYVQSKVFTVIVGVDQHQRKLFVHEAVLSQSPVLQVFCQGGFRESATKVIELKDDAPAIFQRVIDFLYRRDYEPFLVIANENSIKGIGKGISSWPAIRRDRYAMESASVYIMADKYQLDGLKVTAAENMEKLQPLSSHTFFTIASRIYTSVPESDMVFRDFFAKYAPEQLKDASAEEIRPYVVEGGLLAMDMWLALRSSIVAPDFNMTASTSDTIWRKLYSVSALARKVYRILEGVRYVNMESSDFPLGQYEAGAPILLHNNSKYYAGSTPKSLAEDTNESLENVRAAAFELTKVGLLIVLWAPNGNHEELWDVHPMKKPIRQSLESAHQGQWELR